MRLIDEELTPMVSPKLAKSLGANGQGSFRDFRKKDGPPLLNYLRSAPDWVDWKAWFKAMSLDGPGGWSVKTLSSYSQTIGEAIRGNGIALGSVALLNSELREKRLVRLARDVYRSRNGYYLCHKDKATLSEEAKRLADFLSATAQGSNALSC